MQWSIRIRTILLNEIDLMLFWLPFSVNAFGRWLPTENSCRALCRMSTNRTPFSWPCLSLPIIGQRPSCLQTYYSSVCASGEVCRYASLGAATLHQGLLTYHRAWGPRRRSPWPVGLLVAPPIVTKSLRSSRRVRPPAPSAMSSSVAERRWRTARTAGGGLLTPSTGRISGIRGPCLVAWHRYRWSRSGLALETEIWNM